MPLEPYQQRVVDEKTELDERLRKLRAFAASDTFLALLPSDARLLGQQAMHMMDYSEVLRQRINNFKGA